jgi:hypothetical protein
LGNRAYLINTSWLTADPSEVAGKHASGHISGEVASSNDRLLIPWFCCFRKSDLRPVKVDTEHLELPCTTLKQAVRNLEHSLPIFEALAHNPKIAHDYWTLACTLLRRLPLPYLTMDPTEVFFADDPKPMETALVGALSGDLSAIPHLKKLTDYDDSVLPYPIDALYSMGGGQPDQARIWNSSVLDGGFEDFQFITWSLPHGVAKPSSPPPLPDSTFGQLYDVRDLIEKWIKAVVPTAPGSDMGLWPGEGKGREHLQIQIYAKSDADAKQLESDPGLRRHLDQLARTRLEPWCREWGFGWQGFLFQAPDWARS